MFRSRLQSCYDTARSTLLAARSADGHWVGELSTSPLSTATAVMALHLMQRDGAGDFQQLIDGGLNWLAANQNPDGGWGDTTKSISNVSTTMLARAVFHATGTEERFDSTTQQAVAWIDRAGGVRAVVARYGKDKTFSIPILTHCALAGLVDWREVAALPFELACLPAKFYKTVRLPVVSYALPALIAIGQVRHHHRKTWNPLTRLLRWFARKPSLRVLQRIQPSNGGFLEATPLTSFVTMSLAGQGLSRHPVAQKGVAFIVNSVREDGSWPIDTNLATWVTTLAVNALGDDVPIEDRPALRDWLLAQQYKETHPYTNADPGGWAWTNLPGGVPDADDTPGAILALSNLGDDQRANPDVSQAIDKGIRWLLGLQNSDGGFPTFCKGWGTLPFDRSAPDLTAHCLRALIRAVFPQETARIFPLSRLQWEYSGLRKLLNEARDDWAYFSALDLQTEAALYLEKRSIPALLRGFNYLEKTQRPDGSWLPLWFGNQHAPNDENPTYGTARVLAAYRDARDLTNPVALRGVQWLKDNQNADGGWGGLKGVPASIEETALATDILITWEPHGEPTRRGLAWLLDRVEQGRLQETTPIGFYFAKLWYFEALYPLIFLVGTLGRAVRTFQPQTKSEPKPKSPPTDPLSINSRSPVLTPDGTFPDCPGK